MDSASNPLLPLPEELAPKQPPARKRDRSPRHAQARASWGVFRRPWRVSSGGVPGG